MIEINKFPTIRKRIPIDRVFPNKWNPNFQDKEMFEKGKKSVEELGMLGAILVREQPEKDIKGNEWYEIIDGEHRFRYCKENGYTEIDIDSLGIISDQLAKFLTIQLNNLRGKDDILKRAELLKQLSEGQLSLLPFDNKQIEEEMKLLNFDFSQYEKTNLPDEEIQELCVPLGLMLKAKQMLDRISKERNIKALNYLSINYDNLVIALKKLIEEKSIPICKEE